MAEMYRIRPLRWRGPLGASYHAVGRDGDGGSVYEVRDDRTIDSGICWRAGLIGPYEPCESVKAGKEACEAHWRARLTEGLEPAMDDDEGLVNSLVRELAEERRLTEKLEQAACQCEPMIGHICRVHQDVREWREGIKAELDRREAEEDAKIYAEGKKAGGRERAVAELRMVEAKVREIIRHERLYGESVFANVRETVADRLRDRSAEIEAEGK